MLGSSVATLTSRWALLVSGLATAAVVGAIAAIATAPSSGGPTDLRTTDYGVPVFEHEQRLVASADTIIRGIVAGEAASTVLIDRSPVDPNFGHNVYTSLYPIQVFEVMKGDAQLQGSTVWIKWTAAVVEFGPDGEDATSSDTASPPALTRDDEYVFLLKNASAVAGVSDGPLAARHYFFVGQPALAIVRGDQYELVPFDGEPGGERAVRSGGDLATLRELASRESVPDAAGADQALAAPGRALEEFVEALPPLESQGAVIALVESLGLDPAALGDPSFCRKVQAAVDQFGHEPVDLGC
jgi:hypothetical protein